ncbi:MAG: GTPase [Planctomycetaceae bacterium]
MISRRSIVLGALLALPVLIYVGLGTYSLWTTGLLTRFWWLLPSCWVLTWVLSKIWRPRRLSSQTQQHDVPIPSHWTARDRAAAQIIRDHQRRIDGFTPEQLIEWQFYQAEAESLAVDLARHYHPNTTDPYSALTVPEVLAAVRLVVDDMEQWLLRTVPGSRLLTIKQWKMLRSAPKWYQRVRDTAWVASILINPVSLARYMSSKLTLDPVSNELQTELLAAIYLRFMRQMGFYLIEMNSGRLRGGADAYRRAFQTEPTLSTVGPVKGTVEIAAQPVTVALVGQVSSGKSSLINALTGTNQAAVDILPETRSVERYQVAVGDPPVTVTLLDTPGFGEAGASTEQMQQIRTALQESNAVLVVMDAHSPARESDLNTIRELEVWYAAHPRLKQPPMLGVLTHVDLLRPTFEWSPPYNWREPTAPKEQSIHDAVDYVRGVFVESLAGLVPVCAGGRGELAWGTHEELIPALTAILSDAQAVALLRAFEKELDRDKFKILLTQIRRTGSELLRFWLEERHPSARRDSQTDHGPDPQNRPLSS